MAVKLDESIRIIVMQFTASNRTGLPLSVREAGETRVSGDRQASGDLVFGPQERMAVQNILTDMEDAGFRIFDAFHRRCPDTRNLRRFYHMVRVTLAKGARVSQGLGVAMRDGLRHELENTFERSLWRCRVYKNPHYEDGKEVPGLYSLSINLDVRKPLYGPDGELLKERRRDGSGIIVNDVPAPILPDGYMTLEWIASASKSVAA